MTKEQLIKTATEMWERANEFYMILEYIYGAIDELVTEAVDNAVTIDRVEGPR